MIELVHVHVPKCGGMAFRAALRQVYTDDEIIGMPIECDPLQSRRGFHERCTAASRVVSGHAVVGSARPVTACDPGPLHIAIVRDPLERLRAWWNYLTPRVDRTPFTSLFEGRRVHGSVTSTYMGPRQSLVELVASGRAGLLGWTLDNVFVRFFAGLDLGTGAPPVTPRDLARAIERAQARDFAVFALRELDQALHFCAGALDWPCVPSLEAINLGPGHEQPAPLRFDGAVSSRVRDAAEPLVRYDYALLRALGVNL